MGCTQPACAGPHDQRAARYGGRRLPYLSIFVRLADAWLQTAAAGLTRKATQGGRAQRVATGAVEAEKSFKA